MRVVLAFIIGLALGVGATYAFMGRDAQVVITPEGQKLSFPVITYGSPTAPVQVIEYSSVGCGVCGAFKKHVWPELYEKHIATGNVQWILHAFPLAEADIKAAMLAHCSSDPAALMSAFYNDQRRWMFAKDPIKELEQMAKEHGMSGEEIKQCLVNEELLEGLIADRMYASQKYKLAGTPAFIIGQTVIPGLFPAKEFEKVFVQAQEHVKSGQPIHTFSYVDPNAPKADKGAEQNLQEPDKDKEVKLENTDKIKKITLKKGNG